MLVAMLVLTCLKSGVAITRNTQNLPDMSNNPTLIQQLSAGNSSSTANFNEISQANKERGLLRVESEGTAPLVPFFGNRVKGRKGKPGRVLLPILIALVLKTILFKLVGAIAVKGLWAGTTALMLFKTVAAKLAVLHRNSCRNPGAHRSPMRYGYQGDWSSYNDAEYDYNWDHFRDKRK